MNFSIKFSADEFSLHELFGTKPISLQSSDQLIHIPLYKTIKDKLIYEINSDKKDITTSFFDIRLYDILDDLFEDKNISEQRLDKFIKYTQKRLRTDIEEDKLKFLSFEVDENDWLILNCSYDFETLWKEFNKHA